MRAVHCGDLPRIRRLKIKGDVMFKIVADEALPNAAEVFSVFGRVVLRPGRQISAADLRDADALIIRSVTKVDVRLLAQAEKLKFVGTATAGFDHVDLELLRSRGIAFASAPGSNCISVGDYILSVLLVLSERYGFELKDRSLGIVGCGHTGFQVRKKAAALGMRTVLRDPPRARAGEAEYGAGLDEILKCDIITLHVPLIKEGADRTFHLLGRQELLALKPGAFLINASRGSVVDNAALYQVLKERSDLHAWCDVFEGEPEITVKGLLPLLEGATAHIAGYSFESKRRAAFMLGQDLGRVLGMPALTDFILPPPEIAEVSLGAVAAQLDLDLLRRLVFAVYDVRRDCADFKAHFTNGPSFDLIRKHYRERRELSSLTIKNAPAQIGAVLKTLGFTCR